MNAVFYWTVNMSIAGTVAGLCVLAVRAIKKIPRRAAAVMWLIPLIRAWIPVSIAGKYNLNSLLALFRGKVLYVPDSKILTAYNSIGVAEGYFPLTFPDDVKVVTEDGMTVWVEGGAISRILGACFIVWAIVAAALLITFGVIYFTTLRELRDAERLEGNVYISDKIRSPAVYGVFRPRIILPAEYRDKDNEYVLLHERAHVRHGDNLWRLIGFVTAAVHWFNPLAWLFLKAALSDLELACDERVLKDLGEDGRKKYALALVDAARPKNVFVSAFGGAKLRTRVENVLSYKRISVLSAVGLAALIAAVAYVLLTNAA